MIIVKWQICLVIGYIIMLNLYYIHRIKKQGKDIKRIEKDIEELTEKIDDILL